MSLLAWNVILQLPALLDPSLADAHTQGAALACLPFGPTRLPPPPPHSPKKITGQELKLDGKLVVQALPMNWSPRQPIVVNVSGKPNSYSRFGADWWQEWHQASMQAHLYHDVSPAERGGGAD